MERPPPAVKLPEFLRERARLRPGCQLVFQQFRGEASYVLEDPNSGQFFRLGLPEETLLRKLDGSMTGIEIIHAHQHNPQPGELDAATALSLLNMLYMSGLLDHAPPAAARPPGRRTRNLFLQNPLFIRIPVGNPDPMLTALEARTRWLFKPWFLLLFVGLAVWAGISMATDWPRFMDHAQNVLSSTNWLWLLLSFIFLKIIHELGHGLVCKHLGGRIPEFGIFFMLFTPLTYVDATSSWRFPTKGLRIFVAAAGMLAEGFIAAIAVLIWANTETGITNTIAYNTIISATVVTLLFNLNPLMRYDGYYILSDVTEVPNLYTRASIMARDWLLALLIGKPVTSHDSLWIGLYGLSCLVWRTLLLLSIAATAIVLLNGIGVILVLFMFSGMVISWIKKIKAMKPPSMLACLRGILIVAVLPLLYWLPIHPYITTPGTIEPLDMPPVRVECPGFLEKVFVESGDTVVQGQILARLSNPEELAKLEVLNTQAQIAGAQAHHFRQSRQPQLEARKSEELQSLQSQIKERQIYCASLELRAPIAGKILTRNLDQMTGSFLVTGQELLTIGSDSERVVKITILEENAQMLTGKPGDPIRIFLKGRGHVLTSTIKRIEPSASREIRFENLTALAGGPLAVRKKEKNHSETESAPASGMELLEPHFTVIATLNATDAQGLRSGETCVARILSGQSLSLGHYLYNEFDQLIRYYWAKADHHA
ncbi:efflux RND transporter periplasmic adaptor subunit [soil metagenome]